MQPVSQDIIIYQGDTFDFFFRIRARVWDEATQTYIGGSYINLTGHTGLAQIRTTAAAATPLASFAVTFANQSTVPGGVLLLLTAAQTAALPTAGGVWDVQITNGVGEVRTYIAGKVNVIAEVTR